MFPLPHARALCADLLFALSSMFWRYTSGSNPSSDTWNAAWVKGSFVWKMAFNTVADARTYCWPQRLELSHAFLLLHPWSSRFFEGYSWLLTLWILYCTVYDGLVTNVVWLLKKHIDHDLTERPHPVHQAICINQPCQKFTVVAKNIRQALH